MNSDPESEYVCENCGESIVVPVDISQGRNQEYVEDCPVCCCPNVIRICLNDDGEVEVDGRSEQDLI